MKHFHFILVLFSFALSACNGSVSGNEQPSSPTVASITISPEWTIVKLGGEQQFAVVLNDEEGNPILEAPATFETTGGAINSTGILTAGAYVGRHVVTVRAENGLEATATVIFVTDIIEIEPCSSNPADSNACSIENQYIQTAVDASLHGTGFILKAGIHRFNRVMPTDGDVFVGEIGALMTGAMTLSNFSQDTATGLWTHAGLTMQGQKAGLLCDDLENADGTRYSGCRNPEDLYVNDVAQFQVETLAEVDAEEVESLPGILMNKWFFDYANDKIYFYLPDNPSNHKIEISVARSAFAGDAKNVVVRNIVFEKYANPAQMGVVGDQFPGDAWIVEYSEVRLSHGAGIRVQNGGVIRRSYVHHMGQIGLSAEGRDIEITGNELAYNNTLRFAWGWEGGGAKFVRTENLKVINNYSHHNRGPGLWSDIDNIHVLYENNTVDCNRGPGIFHEISHDAVIRNNIVRLNGLGGRLVNDWDDWLYGAQILSASSPNVEIHNNWVEVDAEAGDGIGVIEQDRGEGTYGPWKTLNNYVHHNEITYFGNFGQSGIGSDYPGGVATIYEGSNLFDSNIYHAPRLDLTRWRWGDSQNWDDFLTEGQEPNGTADTNVPHQPTVSCKQ